MLKGAAFKGVALGCTAETAATAVATLLSANLIFYNSVAILTILVLYTWSSLSALGVQNQRLVILGDLQNFLHPSVLGILHHHNLLTVHALLPLYT